MDAKLAVGRFFMERMMPETAAHLARITAGAKPDGHAGRSVLKLAADVRTAGASAWPTAERGTAPDRRLPVRRGPLRRDVATAECKRLPLPHVPEGERRPVHGVRRRPGGRRDLDARHARDLSRVRRWRRAASARACGTPLTYQWQPRARSASRSARSTSPRSCLSTAGERAAVVRIERRAALVPSATSSAPCPDHDT